MTKTIALDIGGILFKPKWRLQGIQDLADKFNRTRVEVADALTHRKKDFYTGKISENDYWFSIINNLSIQATPHNLAIFYRKYVSVDTEVLAILKSLKLKYTLISCNNCPKEWMDYRIEIADLRSVFSEFITSGYVGLMKPDPKFFAFIVKSNPLSNVLYIDDNEKYTNAAKKLGFRVRLYKDFADFKALLTNKE